jgi:hypothetical protein
MKTNSFKMVCLATCVGLLSVSEAWAMKPSEPMVISDDDLPQMQSAVTGNGRRHSGHTLKGVGNDETDEDSHPGSETEDDRYDVIETDNESSGDETEEDMNVPQGSLNAAAEDGKWQPNFLIFTAPNQTHPVLPGGMLWNLHCHQANRNS